MHRLSSLIRDRSTPLAPQATALKPQLPRLENIRCVAFDIYGTLIISGSGDLARTDAPRSEAALRALLASIGFPPLPATPSLTSRFVELVLASHEHSRKTGNRFPEVEVREIWAALLHEILPGEDATPGQIESLAVAYELATNPVWPMPGAREVLQSLHERALPLGIVSNAQFYTPLLFEAFFDATAAQLGVDADLTFYSYQERHSKPGDWLYRQMAKALAAIGIETAETLFVGNDALKDVHTAASLGFRTALFAGDQRSLRLREDHPGLLPPDAILTDLRQVSDLLA